LFKLISLNFKSSNRDIKKIDEKIENIKEIKENQNNSKLVTDSEPIHKSFLSFETLN